eukprot:scaffold33859_cov28-Tisochrysis_lutea.AAC.2
MDLCPATIARIWWRRRRGTAVSVALRAVIVCIADRSGLTRCWAGILCRPPTVTLSCHPACPGRDHQPAKGVGARARAA